MKINNLFNKAEIREKYGIIKQWDIKKIPGILCSIGVYIFLFYLVLMYSFYAPEGYFSIATNKYWYFRRICLATAKIMIPLAILYYIIALSQKNIKKWKKSISLTDIFMFLFLFSNVISFTFTEYKEEALWGTDGWYMGFAMHLIFIGIYFMISRFYDRKINLLLFFMAVTGVVFLWGLLNRFSIYPIDMHYDNVSFISSLGNINWTCGYWSVFFMIGVVLYVVAEKRLLRVFSGIYSAVALGFGVVEGSDSAYISMGVVFFFLFIISFRKTEYMKRWLEEGIIYCSVCQVMRLIASFAPEELSSEKVGWAGLNIMNFTIKLMLGNVTLAVLVIFILLRILLDRKEKKYMNNNVVEEKFSEMQYIQKLMWLKYMVICFTAAVAIIYLILLIVNTRKPGILGSLSQYPIFLFDGSWGSHRGYTWSDGMAIYKTFSWKERLFGVGADCFSIYAYSIPELSAELNIQWPDARLTNAHNECITYLVNIGIFGLLSFIGIFWSSVERLIEKAERNPLCYVFAASLLSYFFHNQFSFSQVLNTPFIFMMLGLGENLVRQMDGEI